MEGELIEAGTPQAGVVEYESHLKEVLEASARAARESAEAIEIDPADEDVADMLEIANEEMKANNIKANALDELRKAAVGPVNEAVKKINGDYNTAIAIYESNKKLLGGKIQTATNAIDRARREKQRLAEQAAAEERKRLADEARALEAAGKKEEAEQVQLQSELTVAPPPAAKTKLAGSSMRDNWKFRVKGEDDIDRGANFLAAVMYMTTRDKKGMPTQPGMILSCLQLNEGALNRMAKDQQGAFNIPGLEAYNDPIISTSRR